MPAGMFMARGGAGCYTLEGLGLTAWDVLTRRVSESEVKGMRQAVIH